VRLLFLFLSFFTLLSASKHKELERVSLQLHWHYQFEFAGFIAAKEMGFYRDAGLDVTLKEYEDGTNIIEDVLAQKSNFGIYNSLSLVEYLDGKPLVLVSSYFKRAALVLATTPDIKTPKDLIGKRIMAGTKEDFILNYKAYFDGYGVSVDDVILVPHTYSVDDFIAGKVAAMTAFVSNEIPILDRKGIKYNVLDPSDDNLFVLQLELITSHDEVEKHPHRVEAFRKASLKGWEYALTHKEELIDIISQKYLKGASKTVMRDQAKGVEKLILPYTYNIGSIDKNFLNKQMKLFKEYYKIGAGKDLSEYVFEDIYSSEKPNFTDKELAFIKNAKPISLCLRYDQFPIDGYEDGKYIGIMSNVYSKLEKSTSLKFKPIVSSSLKDLKEKIESGRCDILSIYATRNREYSALRATTPFYQTYFTLISELDNSFVSNPNNLSDKLLLTELETYREYLLSLYPFLHIKVVANRDKMMQMLFNKEAYAVVALDEQADYLIDKFGYGKLKINGFLSKEQPIEGSIGVNKKQDILYSILEKSIVKITPKEIQEIVNSWRITRYQSIVDYSLVIKVVGVMTLILLLMIYYQKKLKNFNKELAVLVDEKTKELRIINENLEESVSEKVLELIQKDEILTLQSKQAIMGEMISMIAHQWRQPLNTITLNISNIQIKHMMGNDMKGDELQSVLDEMNETIVYLSETIDDFKTYFHPDKKKEKIALYGVIHKAVNFILPRLKSNGVEVVVLNESNIFFKGYQNELVQVLLNILNNAIDAYAVVESKEKKIEIYATVEGRDAVIYLKDRAGGIDPKNIKKLFEPYFSTKGKNGTGLGLYMSQMIIQKQFKGDIKVKSSNGTSTFKIIMPRTSL